MAQQYNNNTTLAMLLLLLALPLHVFSYEYMYICTHDFYISLYIYIYMYICMHICNLFVLLPPALTAGGWGRGGIAEHLVTVALSSYALLHSTSHIYIYIYIFIYVETNVGNVFVLLLPVLYGVGKGEGGLAEHLFTSVLTCMPWCILSVTYVYIHIDAVI